MENFEAEREAYLTILNGLRVAVRSLKSKYGDIPEVDQLTKVFNLTKLISIQHLQGLFEQARAIDPELQSNPEVVSAYGIIQAIAEENKQPD